MTNDSHSEKSDRFLFELVRAPSATAFHSNCNARDCVCLFLIVICVECCHCHFKNEQNKKRKKINGERDRRICVPLQETASRATQNSICHTEFEHIFWIWSQPSTASLSSSLSVWEELDEIVFEQKITNAANQTPGNNFRNIMLFVCLRWTTKDRNSSTRASSFLCVRLSSLCRAFRNM